MGWMITFGILFLLAILPLGASVRFNSDGLGLKIIAGPLRIQILPAKKKDPDKKKGQKKEKKAKTPKEKSGKTDKKAKHITEEPKEKGGPITDFIPLVKVALGLLNGFRKKLRINHLQLKLIMAADDPCDLAVNYGKTNVAVGNILPLLERCFVIKKRDVEVECDFTASETVIIAGADITITLGRILALVGKYGFLAVKEFIKLKNKRKGGAKK